MTDNDRAIATLSDAEVVHWLNLFDEWPPGVGEFRKQQLRDQTRRQGVVEEHRRVFHDIRDELVRQCRREVRAA